MLFSLRAHKCSGIPREISTPSSIRPKKSIETLLSKEVPILLSHGVYYTGMSKPSFIALLGVIVALSPLLGLPATYRNPLLIVLGLGITGLALSVRYAQRHTPRRTDAFVESAGSPKNVSPSEHEKRAQ